MDRFGLYEFSNHLTEREKTVFSVLIDSLKTTKNKLGELKKTSMELILSKDEQLEFQALLNKKVSSSHQELVIGQSLVSILKSTRLCNLRCTYCNAWRSGPNQVMKFSVLTRAIAYSVFPQAIKEVHFVWHGGEATLLSTEYYKKAIWLQQQFCRSDQIINNAIQTNGTLLTEEWINFFIDYGMSVGVSLDGPPEVNDKRRLDKAGKPTSEKIKQGLQKLENMAIKYGILMVIDDDIVQLGVKRLLHYLVEELHIKQVAILNAIPANVAEKEPVKGTYLSWSKYLNFLRKLFALWWKDYRNVIEIRELSSLVNTIQNNHSPGVCIYAGDCMGKYITIDPNGDLSACDKYIGAKDYVFGNLLQCENLLELYDQSNNLKQAHQVEQAATKRMQTCSWFNVCQGGCPHDRRLNERYNAGFDGTCCGLAPLLEDIQLAARSIAPTLL